MYNHMRFVHHYFFLNCDFLVINIFGKKYCSLQYVWLFFRRKIVFFFYFSFFLPSFILFLNFFCQSKYWGEFNIDFISVKSFTSNLFIFSFAYKNKLRKYHAFTFYAKNIFLIILKSKNILKNIVKNMFWNCIS